MSQLPLRVLTWNVLYRDLDGRADGLAAAIAEVAPDIVVLQETNRSHAEATASRLDMAVIGCGPSAPGGAVTSVPAILARVDVADPAPGTAVVLADDTKTYAVLHPFHLGPRRLVVASVHLTHTAQAGRMALDEAYVTAAQGLGDVADIADATVADSVTARLGQIESLTAAAASLAGVDAAVILAGDFNFVPHGVEYRRLLAAGYADAWTAGPRLGSRDTIIEHNPLISDGPGVYAEAGAAVMTGTTGPLDYTLDYHFVARVRCRAAWVVGRPDPLAPVWHSDHLGVAADHEIAPDRGASVP